MTPSIWRSVILALCAVTALFAIIGLIDLTGSGGAPPWYGRWGAEFGASGEPFHLTALAVDPNGPAYRAGLRQGDLIDIRANSPVERFGEFMQPLEGHAINLTVQRGALTKRISV